MQTLPKQFQEEIERAARRQKAVARHFCALDKINDDALRQWINEKSLDEPEGRVNGKGKKKKAGQCPAQDI